MKDAYCDFCKKKIKDVPEDGASYEFPYPGSKDGVFQFHVEVNVKICTGEDICCECAEKAVRMALDDKKTKKKLIKHIIDPPVYFV